MYVHCLDTRKIRKMFKFSQKIASYYVTCSGYKRYISHTYETKQKNITLIQLEHYRARALCMYATETERTVVVLVLGGLLGLGFNQQLPREADLLLVSCKHRQHRDYH